MPPRHGPFDEQCKRHYICLVAGSMGQELRRLAKQGALTDRVIAEALFMTAAAIEVAVATVLSAVANYAWQGTPFFGPDVPRLFKRVRHTRTTRRRRATPRQPDIQEWLKRIKPSDFQEPR